METGNRSEEKQTRVKKLQKKGEIMKIKASESYINNLSILIDQWQNAVNSLELDEEYDEALALISKATLKWLKEFKFCITRQDILEEIELNTKEETEEE